MSTATTRAPRRKPITKARTRKADPDDHGEESRNVSKRRRGAYRATPREAGDDYGALGRPVWSGAIAFGLVNIPVRLHTAVRAQRVAFHMLHDEDKVRLRRRFVCPVEGKEVHPEHLVRGYEVDKDKYVVVSDEELEGCAPERSRTIEITDFVELSEIDPLYYDKPYYVMPQAGSSKPYRLLVEAMTRSKRVGLARVVMHEKEHLAALRPVNGLLVVQTMYWGDEVVPLSDVEDIPADMKLTEREAKAASEIVKDLSGKFNPKEFKDDYLDCVRKAIEKMAHGDNVVEAPDAEEEQAEAKPARSASNLMAALEASLAKAKGQSKRRKSA